jgi:hypothetical protein
MFKSVLLLLSVFSLGLISILPPATVPQGAAPNPEEKNIHEGIGVDGIVVNESTMTDVTAAYGDGYKQIEHKKYSYEIRYKELGLSFFYCFGDERKKIILIRVQAPAKAVTSQGITLGESSFKDAVERYGEAELMNTAGETWFLEYSGVNFVIPYISTDDPVNNKEAILKRKIERIDVVAEKWISVCRSGV